MVPNEHRTKKEKGLKSPRTGFKERCQQAGIDKEEFRTAGTKKK